MGNRQKQSIKITTKLLCLLLSLLCAAALSGCGRTVLTGEDLEEMWRQEAEQAEADKEAAAAADEPILSLRERGLEQAVLYLDGPASGLRRSASGRRVVVRLQRPGRSLPRLPLAGSGRSAHFDRC